MGNANGGGKGSYRKETVKSASYHTRPLSSVGDSYKPGMDHHGVVVNTNQGNCYLVHHPGPGQITTVTPCSNMSSSWKKSHDIQVKGTKTVQEAYNLPVVSKVLGSNGNYITAGTCMGAASGAQKALEK